MSAKDPIIDRLDAMKDIDQLLRDARKELQRAVDALRAVHEHSGIADYCTVPCTHGDCVVSRTIAEALGVDHG